MSTLVLRLEGPMQSWGTRDRFGIRGTDAEPSKSGVCGLLGAALGMPREDRKTLARLAALRMAVRVDREGTMLRDYHTVGGGNFRGAPLGVYSPDKKIPTVLTERHYLADASFCVAMSSADDAFIHELARALQNPVGLLCLGRRACVPSKPIFVCVTPLPAEEAIQALDLPPLKATPQPETLKCRLVVEAADGSPRYDVPLAFDLYQRDFARRFVQTKWLDRNVEEVVS